MLDRRVIGEQFIRAGAAAILGREIHKNCVAMHSVRSPFDYVAMRGNMVEFAVLRKNRLVAKRTIAVVSRFNLDAEGVAGTGRRGII